MKEIRMILADLQVSVLSMKEAGLQIDVEENGKSFAENADIKATAIQKLSPGDIVLADDSGLEIDALNGEPGIYSARYMGEDTSYRIKNANLIERLNGVPDEKRTARFVCAISAALPGGKILRSRGTIEERGQRFRLRSDFLSAGVRLLYRRAGSRDKEQTEPQRQSPGSHQRRASPLP